jgi:hypothetical protein
MGNNTNMRSTPKDIFLHFLNIFTFYISVISFITLFIQYVNVLFPDPLNFYYTGITDKIRLSSSVLLVAVPVYLLTCWLLGKDLKKNIGKRGLRLRKSLIYFTLFLSAVAMIIDLIILVNNFLSGELTSRFFLKTLVVLAVAAAVFGYYVWDLRRKDQESSKVPKTLGWVVALAVLASVFGGFFIVGTPAAQRERRFDEERITDLQMIQNEIINYWIQKETLPAKLSEMENSISGFAVPQDPQSEDAYEYNVLSDLSFELCAEFKTSSRDFDGAYQMPKYGLFQQNWQYQAGRTCFERTIDPELYKENGQLKAPVLQRY